MSRPQCVAVPKAEYQRSPVVSMVIMHGDPFRITVSHKNDLEGVQWKALSSAPDAPEPSPITVAVGMLLDIEGTPLQNKVAAVYGNILSANCSLLL
ncbi:hypothetical protein BDV27DRAFT_125600 [Aspergillus caelatus]|uniref:Uncharacterized protein n=1 Tax=Aspergillus caelatus TaxID=61420 RepID=A0A5N7A9X7_9EURO|nr:uncharacterized protein BDV27DRAFT_125600 [Aspergillus caelatus]KAE8366168.1 hypothetical protein BDV27DRAFT_125600 [Aspergillus caelatus]